MAKKKKINKNEHIYRKGEDLSAISKKLTGQSYMEFKLLLKNGLSMGTLKDGDILKWD